MVTIALGLVLGIMLIRAADAIGLAIVALFGLWLLVSIIETIFSAIVFLGSIVFACIAGLMGTYLLGVIAWFAVGAIVKIKGRPDAKVLQTAIRWPVVAWSRLVVPSFTTSAQKTEDIIRRIWAW